MILKPEIFPLKSHSAVAVNPIKNNFRHTIPPAVSRRGGSAEKLTRLEDTELFHASHTLILEPHWEKRLARARVLRLET